MRRDGRTLRVFAAKLLCAALTACAGGGQSYAGDRYVNPDSGAAADSGPGTQAQPYATLGAAVAQLKPGDDLHIAAGVYRETLDLRLATALQQPPQEGTPKTVIEADPGTVVWIDGADVVTGWQSLGGGRYVHDGWTVNSQQVFLDGRPLQQIGGTIFGGFPTDPKNPYARILAGTGGIWPGRIAGDGQHLPPWSFYYDAAAQQLYIRVPYLPLGKHRVEVSTRSFLVIGNAVHDLVLRNLHFRHSNTTAVAQSGAISITGSGVELDRLVVVNADGAGIDITGDHNVVRGSDLSYCGQLGLKARGTDVLITDDRFSFNNTRGFNKWWEAGGAKFVGNGGLHDSTVTRNLAYANHGDGIWFDWQNGNDQIDHNISAYNEGFGLQYEASTQAHVHDNYFFGNKQRGIYLPNSSQSDITHNLVAFNGLEGIAIVDVRKAPNEAAWLVPHGSRVIGNIVAWNGGSALVLPDNAPDNDSSYNLYIVSNGDTPHFSLGWGSKEQPVRIGLGTWQAATNHDQQSQAMAMDPPAALTQALAARELRPDWSAVLEAGAQVQVPVSLTAGTPPDEFPAGPRP